MDTDFFLVRKMKQGDEEAMELFIRRYYADILKYCVRHCGDTVYGEDLTQETFVRFFGKLSDYRHTGKAKNYLYTIAGNLCKNYYKQAREIPLEDGQMPQEGDGAPDEEASAVDRVTVAWALEQLPGEQREVVDLYYFQELKLREIAELLNIGLPLVKYRLRQGKQKRRELLQS